MKIKTNKFVGRDNYKGLTNDIDAVWQAIDSLDRNVMILLWRSRSSLRTSIAHPKPTAQEVRASGHFQNRDKLPKSLGLVLETVLGGWISDDDLPTILFQLTEILENLHGRVIVLTPDRRT